MKKRLSTIRWKKGSGTTYWGVSVMFLTFGVVLALIELYQLSYAQTRTQIVTDAVADGAAVAGITPRGFEENTVMEVAQEILEKNLNTGDTALVSISAAPERDDMGQETGNILISTSIRYTPQYLSLSERRVLYGAATVRAEIDTDSNGWITTSYYNTPAASPPFATTKEGTRNAAYVSWFLQCYLSPEYNRIYQPTDTSTYTVSFLYDYLTCMGMDPSSMPTRSLPEWTGYTANTARTTADGWIQVKDAQAAQNAANAGKPVILTQIQGLQVDVYVVVPQTGELDPGMIATAHVGEENWEYRRVSWNSLAENSTVYALAHE